MIAVTASVGSGFVVPFISNMSGVLPLVVGAFVSVVTFLTTTLFLDKPGSYLPKTDAIAKNASKLVP